MKCKECGYELHVGDKFCSSCGKEVIKEKYCSNCGKLLPEGVRFCSSCGTAVLGDEPEPDETKINPPKDYSTEYETNTREQIEQHDQEQTEQAVQIIEPDPDYSRTVTVNRTLDIFKAELKELGDRDSKSKAVITLYGTRVFEKYFYPLLRNDEKLLALRNIQSVFIFIRYGKEFFAVTNKRVIKFGKMRYLKPKIKICNLCDIIGISAADPSNILLGFTAGEKLEITHTGGRINLCMFGKGSACSFKDELLKFKGETQESKGGNESNLTSPSISDVNFTSRHYPLKAKNSNIKKLSIIGGIAAVLAILMIVFGVLGSGKTVPDLNDDYANATETTQSFNSSNSSQSANNDYGNPYSYPKELVAYVNQDYLDFIDNKLYTIDQLPTNLDGKGYETYTIGVITDKNTSELDYDMYTIQPILSIGPKYVIVAPKYYSSILEEGKAAAFWGESYSLGSDGMAIMDLENCDMIDSDYYNSIVRKYAAH